MLMQTALLVFCIACFTTGTSGSVLRQPKSYEGFFLVRITPTTQEQLDYVVQLSRNSTNGLDFWLRTTGINRSADVMLTPENSNLLLDLAARNISFEKPMSDDIGKVIQQQLNNRLLKKENFFEQYRSLVEINDFLHRISLEQKNIASLLEIGRSTENRPLYLIKLSTSKDSNKPAIWIQGGAHAREQIGPAVVLYLVQQFARGFSICDEIKNILNVFDLYLLPVSNPDGYDYAFYWDLVWRKTRSFNPSSPQCLGVDLNRNWDFHWNEADGSSNDPCSIHYAGPAPFSEPEARALSNYMLSLRGRLLLFMDMHSYSERWLAPWGYTKELPPNYDEQIQLAKIATSALESVHGIKYKVGSSAGIFYIVSGGARDWAYGVAGATYSYTVELRDDGTYGFLLPADQITPTCEETWAGVKAMTSFLAWQEFAGRSPDTTK